MDPWSIYKDINYLAVFFCVVVAYVLGFVWYNPKTFGTAWMNMVGLNMKDAEKNGAKAMLWNLPITIVIALYVAGYYTFMGVDSLWYAVGGALDLGVFVCLFIGMHYLYEMRPMKLFLITAGYTLVSLAAMGLIVGLFG